VIAAPAGCPDGTPPSSWLLRMMASPTVHAPHASVDDGRHHRRAEQLRGAYMWAKFPGHTLESGRNIYCECRYWAVSTAWNLIEIQINSGLPFPESGNGLQLREK
jgi:hypothetical protein